MRGDAVHAGLRTAGELRYHQIQKPVTEQHVKEC